MVFAGLFFWGCWYSFKILSFEIRSPAHQQIAIHAVQQILPDPSKPIVVTIQDRTRSLVQNRKLWACLGDV
ncbi:recombination protein NinB, partial [Salmonella enterica]|uniref:recombination protein NinB n=1 Tax=Salmonella enterica TaxID=28901 RepID=UPI0039C70425